MKMYSLLFVLLPISMCAQTAFNRSSNNPPYITTFDSFPSEIDLSTYDGSIYTNDTFIKGNVTDKLSQQIFDPFLRYDAHNDAFQSNSSNIEEGAIYIKKSAEIEVNYLDDIYKYIDFENQGGNSKKGYVQELLNIDGSIIYYRQEKKLKSPEKATSSYHTDKKGSIYNNNYFIVKFNNEAKAEKISKKNITTFFSENLKEKVAQITKEKKLKYKNPEDIKTLAKLLK